MARSPSPRPPPPRELPPPPASSATDALRARLASGSLPGAARDAALADLERLGRIPAAAPEHQAVAAHLEWLLDLPWDAPRVRTPSLALAREILDRDHFALTEAKQRLLELVATVRRRGAGPLPATCLAGPPGTGKTTLVRSIAAACGRPFARLSLAGLAGEAELKGTRRMRVGAFPGAVLEELRRVGTRAPVFLLDEIDKMAPTEARDPSPAVVEMIDSELVSSFLDLYLDVPFDLSQVLFIATAHVAFDVPRTIRDRLDFVTLPGYTRGEKLEIAKRHLLPRAARRAGLRGAQGSLTDAALVRVIADHTKEAGVRALERALGRACRRLAYLDAIGTPVLRPVDAEAVGDLLGPAPFDESPLPREPAVGVAVGLAWTADGGVVQLVEALAMTGSGRIVVTGRLGDVMRESADIAYSWVRANARRLLIDEEKAERLDLHVHAPEGGVRKDGPSAGVAIAAAIVSALTGRPLRPDVAMTGELTLRGQILAVGGVREKVSAAQRAGLRHLLLPAANRRDVEMLGNDLKGELRFEFLERIDPYLTTALLPAVPA